MDSRTCHKEIGRLRKNVQSQLNNSHIWASVAIQSLQHNLSDDTLIERRRFEIPAKNGRHKTVIRESETLKSIMLNAIDTDIYQSIFIVNIAEMEAFLSDLISTILLFEPRRILTSIQGVKTTKSINLNEVIHASSQEDLLKSIIDKQVGELFYAKPSDQFIYLDRVIGVKIDSDLQNIWCEIKATRDLLVHNSCIVNSVYVNKSKHLARGIIGTKVKVDQDYFEKSLVSMKSLSGQISSQLQNCLKKRDDFTVKRNN